MKEEAKAAASLLVEFAATVKDRRITVRDLETAFAPFSTELIGLLGMTIGMANIAAKAAIVARSQPKPLTGDRRP